jgi:hypothetical protein
MASRGKQEMSALAAAIYEILRTRTRRNEPRITYKELAAELRDFAPEFEYAHQRNRELYAALGEVGKECRRLKLPPLPALVVRADTMRPGAAYYNGAARIRSEQVSAWRRDLEAVKRSRYPRCARHSQA